jgi:hypothetical protein
MGTVANVLVGVATLEIRYPIGGSYVNVGYTEDGVQISYEPSFAFIEVEEEVNPLKAMITKETIEITANLAESTLFNMDKAMAGSVLAGSVVSVGAGVLKEMSIRVVGKNPAGFNRTIEFYKCIASGRVGMSYKRDEKTVVPVTFTALKETGQNVMTLTDSTS